MTPVTPNAPLSPEWVNSKMTVTPFPNGSEPDNVSVTEMFRYPAGDVTDVTSNSNHLFVKFVGHEPQLAGDNAPAVVE